MNYERSGAERPAGAEEENTPDLFFLSLDARISEIGIWGGYKKNLWHLHGAHDIFHKSLLFSLPRRHRSWGIC